MKILLVDDEREICTLLAAMLAKDGIRTASAHTLAEARGALSADDFDAVFVDIHLPDGMGYDLIPMIRRQDPKTKVIAISAVDGEGDLAMRRGVDLFLSKPFTRRVILEKLRSLLPSA
jgi:DNA-binding response OmpR family regulator